MARVAPYLSDSLRALLTRARQRREADVARAPEEKPSFADGDLFSSLFEGPTSFIVGTDPKDAARERVPVRFTYATEGAPVTWTDRVVIVHDGTRAFIDDVEYGGKWPFANHGSLRASLLEALDARP